ncbi:D-alanyl-D-alanine carboxypeptidase family protein [Promicromonospora sp. NPDC019610]|uniref:D-alanyl-D-alanine carboxypeptidase family protein n=1 Tax=Promicromonospora sp. NPDC019610 TaxID=3364405 RepID=UPI0037A06226
MSEQPSGAQPADRTSGESGPAGAAGPGMSGPGAPTPRSHLPGAAFRRPDVRRRGTLGRPGRSAWTGVVALAVTGSVLVSASASVPPAGAGLLGTPTAGVATVPAASGPGQTAARLGAVRHAPPAPSAVADGVTVSQVLAVLDRAELTLRQSSAPSPGVAQAAAELGMLYTTYQAQQLALAEAGRPLRVESAPTAGEARTAAPAAEVVRAEQVSHTVTGALRQTRAPEWGPSEVFPPRRVVPAEGPGYVTFDEVAVAAMRLANMLDPSSPTALLDTLPDAGTSLRRNLLETVAAYGESTAGYANGRIPADVLCALPFAPGHLLRCDAAERLTALSARFEDEFGYPIPLTDSYRSYDLQVAVKGTKPHHAAIPGTSNHGWGLAIDLGDPVAGGSSPEYVWLRLHAPGYGWDNPSWARLDGAKPEPWHFEFFAAGSVPNRAIDPADVGTWRSPAASRTEPADPGSRPAEEAAATKRPASGGDGSGADSGGGQDGGSGGTGGSGGGSSTEPGGSTPTTPEPPAPAEPTPTEPPAQEDPDSPTGTGLVEDVVGGTVGLVGDTVEGVVGGVVGGLLGDGGASGATNQAG